MTDTTETGIDADEFVRRVPLRVKTIRGEIVPCFPDECEPHTDDPGDDYMAWDAWAERMSETHVQRQCRGCGLFAIWEPKGQAGSPAAADPDGRA